MTCALLILAAASLGCCLGVVVAGLLIGAE